MTHKWYHEEISRGKESMKRLAESDIAILGAGALGANLAVNLARMGMSRLTVIDRDRVEEQNIGTQVYGIDDTGALKAELLRNLIFREVGEEISALPRELNEGNVEKLLAGHFLVVDTFDNSASRKTVTDCCLQAGQHCLHAGINDRFGEVRWNESYIVPSGAGDDVCAYPLARSLILLVVAVISESVIRFLLEQKKESFSITLSDLKICNTDCLSLTEAAGRK